LAYGDQASFEVEAELDGSDCSDSPQSHASEEKTALEVMRLWATDYLGRYPALERDRQIREGTEEKG
jgi:hypothetical protein